MIRGALRPIIIKKSRNKGFFVGLTGWTDDGLGVRRPPHLVHLTAFLSGISAALFWAIVSWFLRYICRQLCPVCIAEH
jgi:hypothetical protein